MKTAIAVFVLALATLCSPAAKAWNCSNPLAERVLVPAGTAGTFGDGDGQLANFNGQLFMCKVVPPSTPKSGGTISATNTNTNSNSSSSNSSSTSGANSTSNSGSTSSATGGNSNSTATANGGNATGGNATGGNSSSGVSNSGNSTSTNNNTATGGAGGAGGSATATGGDQKQKQSQSVSNSGNSKSTASNNGNGNGNNANNSTSITNVPRQVASAVAPPVFPTVTCFKGISAAAQGGMFGASFGGGKIDVNCAILEAARAAKNRLAFCKVYVSNKYVKAAGVTMSDCMEEEVITVEQGPATVIPEPTPVQPIVVNVPAPVVQVIAVPAPVVVAPQPIAPELKKKSTKRVARPCVPKTCPPAKPVVWNEDMVERLNDKG